MTASTTERADMIARFEAAALVTSDGPQSTVEAIRAEIRKVAASARRTPDPAGAVREAFLSQLRRVNTDRYHAWVGDGQDAGILFDAAELGGEVGELLNVVKKLVREEAGWRGSRADPADFADECADVLICLDKLARRRGVDLEAVTIAKFNATSDKVGLPHMLSAAPLPAALDDDTSSKSQARTIPAANPTADRDRDREYWSGECSGCTLPRRDCECN